ncbi:MAG: hypothetical protein IJB97_06060 [Clostridia bacterium]|nr:hypothetical protein [Clostridia bacterium]
MGERCKCCEYCPNHYRFDGDCGGKISYEGFCFQCPKKPKKKEKDEKECATQSGS